MSDHDSLTDLLGRWRQDADSRKRRFPNDPIATALEVCAAEVDEILLGLSAVPLSPGEYARLHGVTPQAVTQWCRTGRLEAYRDSTGHWRIPPHAKHMAVA
jgi:hypothetical protein